MNPKPRQQKIIRERRQYNQWVASQTLEDYALRFTADKARKSSARVGNTALGPIAFLACEAIGGTLTLLYGFPNVAWAVGAFAVMMFLIGLPIAYYAAKYGVDIDLLTRGAGFGYMGSTVTSLIYASFTFLLFAIEASIMSVALNLVFGIPMWVAHIISSLVVIPIALYGISLISKMQIVTQPIWLVLQFIPIAIIAWNNPQEIAAWTAFSGSAAGDGGHGFDFVMFGLAASVLLSLLPQIGEQVDYLRFLPAKTRQNRVGWWTAVIGTGPGWVLLGGFKLLVGSFLAVWLVRQGVHPTQADEPTVMYHHAFREIFQSPGFALVLTGVFVIVCQLKINVTNAYAGSIAWSNFFSRLTHSHPGRVVWLVFNVVLALILMEVGIFRAIESILVIYANFAAGWIGALTADLVINKPVGLSPRYIEFKRAHLYDINPVGVGALAISVVLSSLAFMGAFGHYAQILSPFVALFAAFFAAPLIAIYTRGRYYLARPGDGLPSKAAELECSICENVFERGDIAMCPAYSGPICSLCCTLEARCRDACKEGSRFNEQLDSLIARVLPARLAALLNTRAGHFGGLLLLSNLAIGFLLGLIYQQFGSSLPAQRETIKTTLWLVYFALLMVSGVMAWLIVLAHESRRAAEAESARQTGMLMDEIDAHKRTDAALQKAKEVAEAANVAKTRYIAGISHEIRTPLNSIYGYAQLLERGTAAPSDNAIRVIRRSAEHLADLIDGILDISKIENGILRLNRDRVPLAEFLDQIVDMFRLQAAAKGIEFIYTRPPNLPAFVHVDAKRLRQIVINLVSNAIKYTERGSASLTVRYRSQVAEFEVSDTGVGIPADELERVFEPFERGRGANVRAIPGTGLGLTITKLLTQIMGGEINAQSVVGRGTTFTVRLLLSEAAPAAGGEPGRAASNYPQGYVGPRRRLLIVDDDAAHVDIVKALLGPLGFELFAAGDGPSGLELAAQCRPDLALVDLSMPGMTGWQVVERLRAMPGHEALRVVIVSANAHEYTPGGAGAPHDAFLIKPIDVQRLLECLAAQLDLRWVQPAAAASASAGDGSDAPGLPAHALHHVDDLYQLGLIGHVRGIQAKLREMENEPGNRPFAARMRTLVANFDLKRYMHVLEGMRKHG
jgi:signal transduction histidine kinase/DNA-binding NarL/FixJ family response regulator/purine-cytosine permease-like protein